LSSENEVVHGVIDRADGVGELGHHRPDVLVRHRQKITQVGLA